MSRTNVRFSRIGYFHSKWLVFCFKFPSAALSKIWGSSVTFCSMKKYCISVISKFLSPRHGASSGCGWRNGLQIWRIAGNILISSLGQPARGGPPAWGLGEVVTTLYRRNLSMLRNSHESLLSGGFLWMRNLSSGSLKAEYFLTSWRSFGIWRRSLL